MHTQAMRSHSVTWTSAVPLFGDKSLLPAGRRLHPLSCLLTFPITAKSRHTWACQHSGASHFLFLPAHFSRSMSDQGNPILHVPTFYVKTEQLLSKINSVYRQGLEKRPLETDENFPGLTAASLVSASALEPRTCWLEGGEVTLAAQSTPTHSVPPSAASTIGPWALPFPVPAPHPHHLPYLAAATQPSF